MKGYHLSIIIAAAALLGCSPLQGQVPVVDAAGSDNAEEPAERSQNRSRNTSPGSNNEIMVTLYLQLEELKQEVQNLRGIVEEQGYKIRRMETEQRDRYLDLDRRLSVLTDMVQSVDGGDAAGDTASRSSGSDPSAGSAGGGTGTLQGETETDEPPILPTTVSAPSSLVVPEDETELYRTALDMVLEEANYEDAVTLFQQYMEKFPEGRYISNAHYWQGEALILVEDYNRAKAAFNTLLEDYPDDPKAAGAYLKLGVVYNRMGDREMAREIWESLPERYPESQTEIRAAQDYLRNL